MIDILDLTKWLFLVLGGLGLTLTVRIYLQSRLTPKKPRVIFSPTRMNDYA